MKEKLRINGKLPGEKEVVLGYVKTQKEIDLIIKEYTEVYGSLISFRVRTVIMLPYKKGVALINFMAAISGQPVSNFNCMFNNTKPKKNGRNKRSS